MDGLYRNSLKFIFYLGSFYHPFFFRLFLSILLFQFLFFVFYFWKSLGFVSHIHIHICGREGGNLRNKGDFSRVERIDYSIFV